MSFIKTAILLTPMLVVGCGRPTIIREPVEVPIVRYEPVPVPEALLTPCQISLTSLESNQDLELTLAAALLELKRCTGDKERIRSLR